MIGPPLCGVPGLPLCDSLLSLQKEWRKGPAVWKVGTSFFLKKSQVFTARIFKFCAETIAVCTVIELTLNAKTVKKGLMVRPRKHVAFLFVASVVRT